MVIGNNKCTVMSLDWHSSWQNKGLIVNNEGILYFVIISYSLF